MFEAAAFEEDGAVRSLAPILLVPDHRSVDSVNTVQRSNLRNAQNLAGQLWSTIGFNPELMRTVLNDAEESNLINGERPEQYSPAGYLDAASVRSFNAEDDGRPVASSYRLRAQQMLLDGSAWFTFEEEGKPRAAVAFGTDAFILPVPSGTQMISIASEASTPWERESEDRIMEALTGALQGEVSRHIMWRIYHGANTACFDGGTPEVDGLHRLLLGGARMFGILVARLVYSIPMSAEGMRSDPFIKQRLKGYEESDRATADRCPRIDAVEPSRETSRVVIAVHGTMSTAVPLAAAVCRVVPQDTMVIRFEHDTWQPIRDNALMLTNEVRRFGAERIALVAHSRGGLVARHAAQLLRNDRVSITTVTLGTPFGGTPIIEGVQKGLLGVRVLLGGLRTMTGSPFVDAKTRILGWLLKGRLPMGLSAMSPQSEYISAARDFDHTNIRCFGGTVEHSFNTYSYGLSCLRGFAEKAFNGHQHDLVVGLDSACDGWPAAPDLSCDHFSYLEEDAVLREIASTANQLYAPHLPNNPR
jgi:hypothetical protein